MNVKIMKLLENSIKEVQTLTDINPQSCLTEIENKSKDPIEDAFSYLRSLLTFQTALKKSAAQSFNTENTIRQSQTPRAVSQEWNTESNINIPQSKTSVGSMHFSEISESTIKDSKDMDSSEYVFRRSNTPSTYSKMHSSRSISREYKKKKTTPKIYSQLLSSRNTQFRGNMNKFIFRTSKYSYNVIY